MKAKRTLFVLPALIAVLTLLPAGRVTAQTFTTLYSFTATSTNSSGVYTNSDGANPYAGLITNSSGNTLYGTARNGGSSGNGAVFAVNTDGTGFTNLHSFTGGSDGSHPFGGLILSGHPLYGTASGGGISGAGTVFAINIDGTGITNLHSFTAGGYDSSNNYTNSDGAYPQTGLVISGNILYGAAFQGGSSGVGTVFAVNTDGTGFRNVYSLEPPPTGCNNTLDCPCGFHCIAGFPDNYCNRDYICPSTSDPYASYPSGGLIISGNTLYGTANGGTPGDYGSVFAVTTQGTSFRNLYGFLVSIDSSEPHAGLILSGNILYGTATTGQRTVFAIKTDGTGFTTLDFLGGSSGANPQAGLVLSGNTLYGAAAGGGSSGHGTVFAVKTNGSGLTSLHSFTASSTNSSGVYTNRDGANPQAGLILSGNTLYGTARNGGSSGNGTVFSLSFRPQLTIVPSGTNIILLWPTNVAGFDYTGYTLQSAPALTGTFTNLPTVTSPSTNPITGPQQFYRLSQ